MAHQAHDIPWETLSSNLRIDPHSLHDGWQTAVFTWDEASHVEQMTPLLKPSSKSWNPPRRGSAQNTPHTITLHLRRKLYWTRSCEYNRSHSPQIPHKLVLQDPHFQVLSPCLNSTVILSNAGKRLPPRLTVRDLKHISPQSHLAAFSRITSRPSSSSICSPTSTKSY
jgi:hypothetical protein